MKVLKGQDKLAKIVEKENSSKTYKDQLMFTLIRLYKEIRTNERGVQKRDGLY